MEYRRLNKVNLSKEITPLYKRYDKKASEEELKKLKS